MNATMDLKLHGSESSSGSDAGKHHSDTDSDSDYSVDKQEARGYAFSSTEVNMTNCHLHCERFFKSCKTIHFNQLIANWMMAGYLGPVGSVEEAYHKGLETLYDLIYDQGVLHFSDKSDGMLTFAESAPEKPIDCKHEGLCVKQNLVDVDFFSMEKLGDMLLADGTRKPRKVAVSCNHTSSNLKAEYISLSNPTLASLEPLLDNVTNLTGLLLRGSEFVPQSTFPLGMLRQLTVLEVSGSTCLTTVPESTISQLAQLQYLNLSHLLIESLPGDFFSQLFLLRWLILRGCSKLTSLPGIDSSCLLVLDLSHCTALQNIARIPTEKLHMVDLSYTTLTSLPSGCYTELTQLLLRDSNLRGIHSFERLESLRVLDLSGAKVNHIDNILAMKLHVLDLSRTRIEYIEFNIPKGFESVLRYMRLRECTSLKTLPTMKPFPYLEKLDISGCDKILELPGDASNLRNLMELNLSGCSRLGKLSEDLFGQMTRLSNLNLCRTNLKNLPPFTNLTSLSKLSLSYLVLDSLETLTLPLNLEELDLKGLKISSSQELKLDFSEPLEKLQILNLSQTSVVKLQFISKLVSLRELILADCQHLEAVPDLHTLTNLEVLDLSLTDDCTVNFQAETEIEPQRDVSFSAASSLRKLVLTNRSGVQRLFPLTSIDNLEFLDLRGTDVTSIPCHYMEQIKCIHLPAEINSCEVEEVSTCNDNLQEAHPPGRVSKPVEIHIVSTTEDQSSNQASSNQPSGVKRFKDEFTKLDSLVSEMKSFKSSMVSTTGTTTAATRTCNEDASVVNLVQLHSDLKYIQKNIDRYNSSRNHKTCEELLRELMDAATHLSAADFLADSTCFSRLVRIVVKLKLLIPPPKEVERPEASGITKKEKKKKEKLWFKKSKNEQRAADIASSSDEWPDLLSFYESLTSIQKNCLLCFAVFPFNEDDDDNARASQSLVIKKRMLFYWWLGEGFLDPTKHVFSTEGEKIPKTIEEIGEHVSKALTEKGFIEPVMEKGRETGNCRMHLYVHSFVTVKAKEEAFFDINQENGMLTPHFTRSGRACLLKPQDSFPSSCRLWANYKNFDKNLKSFGIVRTLVNVNDCLVDIKPEWFSKMKYLSVLLLGSWLYDDAEHIEIEDQTFLEELKNMKQLTVLSLQGLFTIKKLPGSVCKLTNLIVLDLRECSYLEELPTGIGSLKSLAHLDITNCRLLTKLPKGVRLLSKLEVLKGFVISNQESRKACVFEDLLNLKMLRKLSIIVSRNIFPDQKELQVLKGMDNLRELKILWERDFNITEREQSQPKLQCAITEEILRRLKCLGHQSDQDSKDDTSRNEHLGNIEKLELWCFPCKTAPQWLDPSELKNLEKLYIVGGILKELHGGTDENNWNVTTLRLKYLPNLHFKWRDLKNMFPKLTYLERYKCPELILFPCDEEGVWMHEISEEE